jgi:hypothetical protein
MIIQATKKPITVAEKQATLNLLQTIFASIKAAHS